VIADTLEYGKGMSDSISTIVGEENALRVTFIAPRILPSWRTSGSFGWEMPTAKYSVGVDVLWSLLMRRLLGCPFSTFVTRTEINATLRVRMRYD